MLLLGFAAALRRSELVALRVEDLSPSPDGIRIRIATSKADQHGRGHGLLVVYAEPTPIASVIQRRFYGNSSGPRGRSDVSTDDPSAVVSICPRRYCVCGRKPAP